MKIPKFITLPVAGIGFGILTPLFITILGPTRPTPTDVALGVLPAVSMGLAAGWNSKTRIASFVSGAVYGFLVLFSFSAVIFGIGSRGYPLSEHIYWGIVGAVVGIIASQIGLFLEPFRGKSKRALRSIIILAVAGGAFVLLCSLINFSVSGITGKDVMTIIDKYSCPLRGGEYGIYWNLEDMDHERCNVAGMPVYE